MKKIPLLIIFSMFACVQLFAQADWAHLDANNKLVYKKDALGNHITDFSYAGYMGGGVAIPNVPVKITLNAASGDQTAAIQNAINQVSSMPLVNGFRGAVLLGPGTFTVSATININASGVVLRGSGMGANGTIIQKSNTSAGIVVAGKDNRSYSNKVNVTGTFLAAGSNTFNVTSAAAYKVGDMIVVNRVVTAEWVAYVGMDNLVRNGAKQTWISAGTVIRAERFIKAINGNTITVDCPLVDSYDSKYLGAVIASMEKLSFTGRISQVGVESLTIKGVSAGASGHNLDFENVIDGWAKDINGLEGRNCYNTNGGTKQITWDHVLSYNSVRNTNTAAPEEFQVNGGTQILFNKCESKSQSVWGFLTQARGTGPIVILNCSTAERGINPHQRWTVGILADGGNFGSVQFMNLLTGGSGHGWPTGWSVAWNVTAGSVQNEAAPGTMNWVIGGTGKHVVKSQPQGIYDHDGQMVIPQSLYLQQLYERLGQAGLDNIGYGTGNKAPSVSIISPANNASFTAPASVTINANASDADGNISKVEFFNGTTKLGEDATSPYSFAWSNVAAGTYSLTAKATDNKGATTTSIAVSISVKTNTPNVPPTVSITSPANNASFTAPASLTINANAADSDGSVAKVEFFNGTTKLGEDASSPYSFSWSNVTAGTYSLTAKATDNLGAVTTSTAVSVTVKTNIPTNVPPTVSITSPANNASFTAPASITINANASDSDGSVSKVEFFNGTTKLGEDATSPYAFAWNNVAAGTYTITAKATDDKGATTTSTAVSVTVKTNTNACSGLPTYVENSGYVAGSKVQNAGGIYQCKPYPYTGWCNGAAWAYAPGTGSYWTDCWDKVGSCSARIASTTDAVSSNAIEVYPNPTENYSSIKLNVADVSQAEVTVMNSLGVEVYKTTLNNNHEGKIDLSGMKNGIYMIQIKSNDSVWFEKLVKE